jgi:hypothetical protein
MFRKAEVFVEVATGMILHGLIQENDPQWIEGMTVWGHQRPDWRIFYIPSYPVYHPLKFANVALWEEFYKNFFHRWRSYHCQYSCSGYDSYRDKALEI